MKQATYIIEYCFYLQDGYFETHTTKVRNCMSELHAKVKLETYLKSKHPTFRNLVVYKCTEDIIGIFDFLGKNNPFR